MNIWNAILASIVFALPAVARGGSDEYIYPPEDCTIIGGPIYMCDQTRDWQILDLPEDTTGVGFQFDAGVQAEISMLQSPMVGIGNRAQMYSSGNIDRLISEELTKLAGYPAITYIFLRDIDGKDFVVSKTKLLLSDIVLHATTTQQSDKYTPDHRFYHDEMLAGILYYWDL